MIDLDVEAVPFKQIPGILGQLEVIRARLWARLNQPPAPVTKIAPDRWLTAEQVARFTGRSESWVRKRGHTLPGYLKEHGNRVRWSGVALERWMNHGCPRKDQ